MDRTEYERLKAETESRPRLLIYSVSDLTTPNYKLRTALNADAVGAARRSARNIAQQAVADGCAWCRTVVVRTADRALGTVDTLPYGQQIATFFEEADASHECVGDNVSTNTEDSRARVRLSAAA